jgi:putative DNA-invertase from lambdoid prophage Rac
VWGEGTVNDLWRDLGAMALAQACRINTILVTELSCRGRSALDLVEIRLWPQAWNGSFIAFNGMRVDLTIPRYRLIASVMASHAEFERDLISEHVRSSMAVNR